MQKEVVCKAGNKRERERENKRERERERENLCIGDSM